jgi:hypothetical protein
VIHEDYLFSSNPPLLVTLGHLMQRGGCLRDRLCHTQKRLGLSVFCVEVELSAITFSVHHEMLPLDLQSSGKVADYKSAVSES